MVWSEFKPRQSDFWAHAPTHCAKEPGLYTKDGQGVLPGSNDQMQQSEVKAL